jgi:hypothetical protein
MEQKDYILREIEKIGAIISAIRQKLFGGKEKLAINTENEVKEAAGMLMDSLNFDLHKFLEFDNEKSIQYLNGFKGFNEDNLEEFSAVMAQIGFSCETNKAKNYLQKALLLYNHINSKTKTFSFERENNIKRIEDMLHE